MFDEIASGGMASVHLGRLMGAVGFSRTVAIKYLHPHYSSDTEFVSMFLDEARLAARIQHPNVAAPLDVVVEESGELFLVMEYIHGENLARLIGSARSAHVMIPLHVSASILSGALRGLHAAHEAVDERGIPLNVIHRDISPQNIMVGLDGVARVLDFGVAKAVTRCQSTRRGQIKGKLSYMAPEQMRSGPVDRRLDLFAAGIVLWEALTHKRLFKPEDPAGAVSMILNAPIAKPSTVNREVTAALDQVVMKALERNVETRFQTALEFADALEDAIAIASHRKVGQWVQRLCAGQLSERAGRVSAIERSTWESGSSGHAADAWKLKPGALPAGPIDPTGSTTDQRGPYEEKLRTYASIASHGEIVPPPSPELPPSPARKGRPLVAGVVLLAVVAGLGILLVSRRERPAVHPVSPPPPSAPPVVQVPEPPLAPALVPPAEASTEGEHSEAVAPSPQVGPKPIAKSSPAHKARTKSLAKPAKPSAAKACDPPYFIDANGIRRVKPACL